MRNFIDIINSNTLPNIPSEEIATFENEIVSADFHWIDPPQDDKIGLIGDETVFSAVEDTFHIVSVGSPAHAYLVYSIRGQDWIYVQQLNTREASRGKGWASQLLIFTVKNIGHILIDEQLSLASASMIEKLVASGAVSAQIADLSAGLSDPYDPKNPKHHKIGLYDRPIIGVDRPVISTDRAKNLTWILENYREPRHLALQPYRYYI